MSHTPECLNAAICTATAVPTGSISIISSGEIFTLTVMLMMSTLSLVGNSLVIGAVYMRESLRTPSNLLLLNLAVADLGQGIIAMPLRITEVFNRGTEPLVPCQFVLFVTILFFGNSMITVALISIDRFIAVRWPFLYVKYATHGVILVVITCSWLFIFIFAMVPYLGASITPTVTTKFCLFSQYLSKAYLLTLFSIVNMLIIVILLFTNSYLLKQTIQHITRIKTQVVPIAWNGNSLSTADTRVGPTRVRYHRLMKATRITLVVVALTIVLISPIMIIDVVSIWNPMSTPSIVTKISILLAYANSCVNPWIFAGFNTVYRQTYIEVIQKLRDLLLCKKP